jgi:hypothetical protein
VDVGRAARALADLAASPELRRTMGAAGRERVRTFLDWPVVVEGYRALIDELAAIRAATPAPATRHPVDPVKSDPFHDFAEWATATLKPTTVLSVRPGAGPADLERAAGLALDSAYAFWRSAPPIAAAALQVVAGRGSATVAEVLATVPEADRARLELTLVWMCKLGILAWS